MGTILVFGMMRDTLIGCKYGRNSGYMGNQCPLWGEIAVASTIVVCGISCQGCLLLDWGLFPLSMGPRSYCGCDRFFVFKQCFHF